jgi:hypothetical protein
MGLVRGMWLVLVACGCLAARESSAQTGGAVVTPMAAQKDWYPADATSVVPGWTHGVEGKPFVGTATWTTRWQDSKYRDFHTRKDSVDVMRDGKGRERLAWKVAQGDPRVSRSRELTVVLLLDPVARCAFLWMQDGAGKSVDAVKVRCEPEGVEVPARPAWNELTPYEREDLTKEPESKPRFEDVPGEIQDVGGVEAKNYKHEEVREFDAGQREQRTVHQQRWYADALGMVVQTAGGDPEAISRENSTSFQMEGVKLGEPPAAGFALPADAVVEVDPKLRLVWDTGARGERPLIAAARTVSRGEWPSVNLMAMTDLAGRMLHPAFPEAWFTAGPKVPMPTFYQGPKGMPFDAMGELLQYGQDAQTTSDATQTIFLNWSRDGEGRARLTFRFLNGGSGPSVYVLDPVAGCIFYWNEDAYGASGGQSRDEKPVAKVRCNAHGVRMPAAPRWDDLNETQKAQVAKAGASALQFVNEKVSEERVGAHDADGVDAVKYARYEVHAAVGGKPAVKTEIEAVWYAPALDSVVKASLMPKVNAVKAASANKKGEAGSDEKPELLELLDMYSIWVGEPVEDFYPPHGYAIEVDESLLPPFAPVPKAKVTKPGPR